jgi:hypothetical protein
MRIASHAPFLSSEHLACSVYRLTRARIQEDTPAVSLALKVEHLADGVGDAIEGAVANARPTQPVVFHKSDDRSLIGNCVIHEVALRPGGDH